MFSYGSWWSFMKITDFSTLYWELVALILVAGCWLWVHCLFGPLYVILLKLTRYLFKRQEYGHSSTILRFMNNYKLINNFATKWAAWKWKGGTKGLKPSKISKHHPSNMAQAVLNVLIWIEIVSYRPLGCNSPSNVSGDWVWLLWVGTMI